MDAPPPKKKLRQTRKHSSTMRTARLLTIVGCPWVRMPVSMGVCVPRNSSIRVRTADFINCRPRTADPETDTPLPQGQTDTCENISLSQTSFASGKNKRLLIKKFGFKVSPHKLNADCLKRKRQNHMNTSNFTK